MRFACPACGQLAEAASFRVDGGGLLLTCAQCGAENRADVAGASAPSPSPAAAPVVAAGAPASAAVSPPRPALAPASRRDLQVIQGAQGALPPTDQELFSGPEGCCPKCISPRPPNALACPHCGLVYDNFVAADHQPSEQVRQAWRALQQAWAEPEAHERFLRWAEPTGELAWAGRLYRIRLARVPGDQRAIAGRDAVVERVAGRSLEPIRSSDPAQLEATRRWVLGTVFVVTLVGVVVLLRVLAHFWGS